MTLRWTRRELLGAGCGLAAVLSPAALARTEGRRRARHRWRVGLLQGTPPWIDPRDPQGSLRRAAQALRTTIARALDEHGPIDWLVGGVTALPRDLAGESDGMRELAALAAQRRVRITVGTHATHALPDGRVRLLEFTADGEARRLPARAERALVLGAMRLELPAPAGPWQLHLAPAAPAWTAPHAGGPFGGGTRIVDPRGRVVAAAEGAGETLVIAQVEVPAYS